jgi:uncharacterized membrane protein
MNDRDSSDDIATLKQVPLFAGLDDTELAGVRAIMEPKHYVPGQVIIREGEPGDYFHVITDGDVQFSTLDAGGNELILGEAGRVGFFGELSMLTGDVRAVRVCARDRVSTLALDRNQFHEFLIKHPAAGIDVLTTIARRLQATDNLLRQSVSRNVNDVMDEKLTLGQRIADGFAATMGSWPFIIVQSCILLCWVVLNVTAWVRQWDPYPFILLNLALSFQAAYAAPIIMMSQNRAGDKDRLAAEIDHQVNVKAELKVGLIMNRLDDLERSMHYLHDEQRGLLKQAAGAGAPAR